MAKQGQVTVRGRFKPGARVRLVEVAGEHVLRSQGGREVADTRVGEDGCVSFSDGVKVGGRYFVVGHVDGNPVEVRARGNEAGEESAVLAQAPVGTDRTRLADGSWSDEAPERQDAPGMEVAPGPAQHQVPDGVVQRSATARGIGTPVDPSEMLPYPDQASVPKGTVQASDTPLGQATPISPSPAQRQEDVPDGVIQRSATATGTAAPIPAGDAVEAKRYRDSAEAKAAKGEPSQAAARPDEAATAKRSAPKAAAKAPAKKPARKPAAKKPSHSAAKK